MASKVKINNGKIMDGGTQVGMIKNGCIYDRNNKLLVSNQPSYDIMIIPGLVTKMDTTEFCKLLKIDKTIFKKKFRITSNYSKKIPSVFLAHISKEDYGKLITEHILDELFLKHKIELYKFIYF